MHIVLTTAEAVPFAKTGGLGDVCGALPRELARLGHDVAVIMPAFRQVHDAGLPIADTGVRLEVPIGGKRVEGRLLQSHLPESDVPVYFVAHDGYYDRPQPYQEEGRDFPDNCERFVFFCRGALEALRQLGRPVDLLHANDWTSGLVPAYLQTLYRDVPPLERTVSLMTIHNLAYQGTFWHWDMALTGIDWKYFNWQQMEFFGKLNLLKTGIVFADAISTVSPRYAKEIQAAPLGCGLEGVLAHRGADLTGILNGADYREWNPASDPHLAARYDADGVAAGKSQCKAALQRTLGLPTDPDVPLIAFVGRLVDQKGTDLFAPLMQQWADASLAQWVLLGTGEARYEQRFRDLARRYPQRVAARLEFSVPLAHRIEAGADMLLMPSRFEPCGLNQLYSLRYGTVPIVRATGGLADTITDCTPQTLADGTANGFSFLPYKQRALAAALKRACETYRDKPTWQRLVDIGIRQDWSWARSAKQYEAIYKKTIARTRN